ncbi:iron complex outermembrane receptor protein [Pelomonas saccharophila]|uniref:Iron complex outermembrane receptor protein n=1 Tax=Roseateles saccharophilus TaxID=304 RepID=A0ABU1YSH3_ROSSA|nr:TonB-dependent receptor [Roseateles saccharophilus]MDR7271678.1 iron complex outermembrane receptor protein [Roseateles saccharophilus]
MHKQTKIAAAVLLTVGGFSAWAQQAEPQQIERVTVTGSAIKRIDAESSVPVTVIKMSDLRNSGVTSVEQIMSSLTAVQSSVNAAQSIGSGSGGASFADLRGIGQDKTLVLLNGERIANNAVDGSAPDLNMIPFAAIDRIEVLRDGASALYGTDAIGGVINFITKKTYNGGNITLGYDSPKHKGGKAKSANVGVGFGDLATQNFNVLAFVSVKKEDPIAGNERDFNKRIVGGLSNSTDPANYTQDFSALYNPAAPTCSGTALIPVNGGTQCKIVTPNFVDFAPKSDTASGMLKGTLRVNDALELGAEAFVARNRVTTRIAPVPYGGYYMNPTMPNGQKNPYFPTAHIDPNFDDGTAGTHPFNPSAAFANPVAVQPGFAYVFWRDFPNGSRAQMNENKQSRIMLTADGNAWNWDYSFKASFNKNTVDQNLTGGYGDGDMIGEGLLEGVINPFGAQSAAGTALLEKAALNGKLQTATGKVQIYKGTASRELGDWVGAGRPAQIAIGGEYRREDFDSHPIKEFAQLVSASTGVDPDATAKGKRNVYAAYGELNVPITKALELTGSLRYDKYSDFGNSTNPKLSFRFQPSKEILLRGSASTGFRAPTLFELYSSTSFTNTAGNFNNPINCPGGTPIPGASQANCNGQFQVQNGGNPFLKPEKSKGYTLGAVFEPMADLSLGIDLWAIKIKNAISVLPQSTLFQNYTQFQQYFHFSQPGNLLSITSNCPGPKCGYVEQLNQNLGGTNTNGIDLSAQYRLKSAVGQFDFALNSTFVNKYEYQDYPSGPWNQNVGVYSGAGPIFKWTHNLTANWAYNSFAIGTAVHYKSGYVDFTPTNRVSAFTTTDLYGSWSPIKGASLVLGVRNLFDRDPPFTNQADLFQSGGWDSRYANAAGRTYYVRGTYSF